MIFDLGGARFDVTIVVRELGMIDIMGTSGDMSLGGKEIEEKLEEFILESFIEKTGEDFRHDVSMYM